MGGASLCRCDLNDAAAAIRIHQAIARGISTFKAMQRTEVAELLARSRQYVQNLGPQSSG